MAKSRQAEILEFLFWTGISKILAKTLGTRGGSMNSVKGVCFV